MNEWKKKCVDLHRTCVSKRTVDYVSWSVMYIMHNLGQLAYQRPQEIGVTHFLVQLPEVVVIRYWQSARWCIACSRRTNFLA